jgi:PAS domain S-box-containing protein
MPIDLQLLNLLKNNNSSLVSLDLSYQALNLNDIQILIENLKSNCHLRALNLTGNVIGDEGAILLATHPIFLQLILCGTCIGEAGAISLAKHPTITSLDLSQNKINDRVAEAFAVNTKIETLNLAGNKITCPGAVALARNRTLRSLNLMENFLADSGAACLAQNKTLTSLNLAVNQINNIGAVALANNSTLTSLVLHHNKIEKEAAEAFAKNTRLLELDLGTNKLGDEGAVCLSQNTKLLSLNLCHNFINIDGVSSLVKNPNFKKLNLSYNQISDESASALANNKTLEELDLSYNLLGLRTAMVLAQHPSLQRLVLNYNVVDDEGAIALAGSNSLDWLSLVGNHIGPQSAEAFVQNKKLKTLVLSTNFLDNEGAIALSKNKTLVELLLSYNQIGDEGAIALAHNQTLKTLNLNYNYIQEKGRKALMENKSLKLLLLSRDQPPEFTPQNLNSLFTLSQDFMCILGSDGSVQFFNPHFARILGYSNDELLTRPFNDLLHPDDRKEKNFPANLFSKFPVMLATNRYICKDGSYRWIQWSCQFKNGRIYATGIDVTEQKAYQEPLIDTERKKLEDYVKKQTDFIAYLCHEIRNPLNGVYGNVMTIEEYTRNLEDLLNQQSHLLLPVVLEKAKQICTLIKADLKDMEVCAEYEKNILNDNLDVARIAENKLQLANQPMDIKKALSEVCRMFKAEIDKKGLILDLKLPNEELLIKGDNLRIKQITTNLIINAIKFTEKGRIDVFLNVKSKTASEIQLEISVQDTGVGLTEEELNKLFDRFSQAVTSTNKYGGSGLGLLISKNLAILMGGDIVVESQKGKGSIFHCVIWCEKLQLQEDNKKKLIAEKPWGVTYSPSPLISPLLTVKSLKTPNQMSPLTFPLAVKPMKAPDSMSPLTSPLTAEPMKAPDPVSPLTSPLAVKPMGVFDLLSSLAEKSLRKPKILVVDDIDINRKLLVNNLQKAGYTCLEASNGEDALKIFMTTPKIDIIFMDMVMPGMHGLEAVRRIRCYEKEKQLWGVFIIGVSGNAMENQVQEALQAGINSYLIKPFRREEILKIVSDWRPPVTVQDISTAPIVKLK